MIFTPPLLVVVVGRNAAREEDAPALSRSAYHTVSLAEDGKIRDSYRTLWPFEVTRDGQGQVTRIALDGVVVAADRRLTIAFNSYDAQSGGRRMLKTRDILAAPDAKRTTSAIDTRTALISGLLDRGTIG